MTMPSALPSWDLSPAPGIGTTEDEIPADLLAELAELAGLYQQHDVAGGLPIPPDPALVDVFELLLTRTDAVLLRERLLSLSHAGRCWAGGEQRDADSAAYLRVQQQLAPITALRARLEAWAARLPVDWLTARSAIAAAHKRWLQRCQASRWLPAGEEYLLASLDSTAAATAWRRLYEDSAARVTASLAAWPAAAPHDVAHDRRTAAAWTDMAPVAAACLNAVLGQEWIVAERRGWKNLLDVRLHREGLPAGTPDVARQASPALLAGLRQFTATKARLLGQTTLPYAEISSCLPGEPRWSWDAAAELIIRAFTACDPALGDLADTAFQKRWIDAAPRPGKRSTALCLPMRDGDARIMVTFDGSADSILRLAHELGHAFHHVRQTGQTEWQRESPLLLMELAAMAAEQAIVSASEPTAERTFLLDAWLARVFRTCVLGLARWQFEQEVVQRRWDGPLTEADFDAITVRSQQLVYAAGITSGSAPSHAWISHPHLYTARFSSVPYFLARLAAAAAFPAGAAPHLPPLLASTGLMAPADLLARYGHDLTSTDFWVSGSDAIIAQIDRFTAAGASPLMLAASTGGRL